MAIAKNPDKLVSRSYEDLRLRLALELNKPLSTAYYFKKELW